jgi:8-oxo-dGTP diphosphatase
VPPLPTFALGGLLRADLDAAQRAGAHGIAAIRGAWDMTVGPTSVGQGWLAE